jgi:cellulose synthase/poly-beta-1,6-N-acetylglucosamine synthase-like glycosyltransferase
MSTLELSVFLAYSSLLLVLSFYGSHRIWMAYLHYRHKYNLPTPAGRFAELPRVTVQLPMFNELYVAERVIDSACRLDYPADRLQIQVLDDSIDETQGIARACVERWRQRGVDVSYVHRVNRQGFKAGALEHGLTTAKGELVAVFDADFLPPADYLLRCVHHFTDPKVAVV